MRGRARALPRFHFRAPILRRVVGDERRERAVFLVGMMGSGKSTVGPLLAARLGRPFLDSDRCVEEAAGRSIAEIFAAEGEEHFRRLERETIEAHAKDGAVMALGGGAIAQPGAPERLAALGRVVYLRARVESLLGRVGGARSRPLLAGLDAEGRRARLDEILAEREPAYATAGVVVDTDDRSPQDVADELVRRLGEGAR